jgi:hypothetical protein
VTLIQIKWNRVCSRFVAPGEVCAPPGSVPRALITPGFTAEAKELVRAIHPLPDGPRRLARTVEAGMRRSSVCTAAAGAAERHGLCRRVEPQIGTPVMRLEGLFHRILTGKRNHWTAVSSPRRSKPRLKAGAQVVV